MKNNVHRPLCSESETGSLFNKILKSEDMVSPIMKIIGNSGLGVSATHLDWTMVPYVRKSFYKHYIDSFTDLSMAWIYGKERKAIFYDDLSETGKMEMDDNTDILIKLKRLDKNSQIQDISFMDETFYPRNGPLYSMVWERALTYTERELGQAVEGLFHNLNTLQSRSGNQLKRVAG